MDKKKLLLIIGILGAALILVGGVGVSYSSQPSFCTNCHNVEPAVTSWESSKHNTVDCLKCHAEPGFVGKAKIKIGGLKEVYLYMTEFKNDEKTTKDMQAEVPMSRCFQCHTEEKLIEKNSMHESIIKSGESNCASCHRSAIHDYEKS